eukprot:9476756-Pyramimonas_sp.AAC.1
MGPNILFLEGEALVMGFKNVLRSCKAHGRRILILSDNLPLVLAAGKGRAKSVHLRQCLYRICALSLATGSRLAVRWVPSELNPADPVSRGEVGWFSGARSYGPSGPHDGLAVAAADACRGLRAPAAALRAGGADVPGAGGLRSEARAGPGGCTGGSGRAAVHRAVDPGECRDPALDGQELPDGS